ncbi:uncharacterized protein LOC132301725 [Cornus florida]|uniref:uncharacterized protein LOC132301725 n=1 Tax=Cornus florida TaxID=4283 RepID=UPI00289D84E5|nr:uncharacterized protein LOC132301725 [Cornus florida]
MRFVEALGHFGDNHVVRLREFSKSLTNRAYRWYFNLEPDSISTWEQLKDHFLTKFFQAEERVTTLSLTKEAQEDNEDVLAFINRFSDRAGQCFESSNEIDLLGELKIAAQNLKDLKPVATKYKPPKYDAPKFEVPKPSNRKPAPAVTIEECPQKRFDRSQSKPQGDEPPPFPIRIEEVKNTLAQSVKDGVVVLPTPRRDPTPTDRANADFCVYHQSVTHPTINCRGLRRLFQRRMATGDLEVTPLKDVRRFLYPNHHVAIITCYDELAETNLGYEAKPSSETDMCPLVAFVKPNSPALKKTLSFSNADKQSTSAQNRPLYVLASIKGVEFKRAFLDNGSSINVMPLSNFRKAGISEDRLIKEPIEVAGFGNDLHRTMGYVNVDLAVNKFQASMKFHVIDSDTSYHILLERAWMHCFSIVPSTYHQCFKGIWNNKVVTVPCSDRPFATFEAHYTDALFFNDLDDYA